ncbi:ABC transporter substrate-binding protein [Aquiflexum lacus]|uniref:ABC transporter substrate-binding protein n=1 Tax=Aquiflexum lacus TaxID=2483805 RepID=UPI001894978E|nr:ABC transporter substrate-binding protein [Aquiflexum lacus]
MRVVFFLFLFLTFFSEAYSQDQLADYKRAKTLMGYGNYKEAMDLFRPFMDELEFGELSNYAKYHFAFSAYQNDQLELMRSVLMPLVENRNFDKKDEAKYLLAMGYFKEEKFSAALQEIEGITEPSIYKEAEKASYHFLQNVSVSFLVSNLSKFQKNEGFVLALKDELENQSIMSNDEKAVYQKLKSIVPDGQFPENEVSKNNQVLDIAVILPFNFSGGSDVKNLNAGNFVFDLYQGIDFALKEYENKGVKINSKTFDTQRNMSNLQKILADPFLLQADIIIGPIYPDETEIVMAFSEKYEIPFINPLSNIEYTYSNLEFAYLFRPSVSTLGSSLLDYMRKFIEGKKIALAYSNSTKDDQLANHLMESSRQFGYELVKTSQVTNRNINQFFDDIKLKSDSLSIADVVIILSDDPNIASLTFGFMESQNVKTPVVVLDSWLYFNFASFEMLENQNFVFIGNNTINFGSPELDEFRNSFYEKHLNYPSFNSHLGYEIISWVVETISPSKGFEFRKNLNQRGFQSGKVTYGLDFTNSFNNRYVPILKLENGVLKTK